VDSKRTSQATTGIVLIVIGLILLGRMLHFGPDLGGLWPLILIVVGASRFLTVDADGHRGNGAWLLLIGGLFLLNNLRILGFGDSWPLLIVAVGISIVFGRGRDHGRRSDGPAVPDPATASRPADGTGNGSVTS
jgi:hypothetical protein